MMSFYFFFAKNMSFLEFQFNFKEVKTKRKFFRQSLTKKLSIFLSFRTISLHRK